MSDEDRLTHLWNSVKGASFGTGLEYEFVTFKTEVLTTLKVTNDGVKASNARMNLIIGGLSVVIALGILLCSIFALAISHSSSRSMLLTSDPTYNAASLGGQQ